MSPMLKLYKTTPAVNPPDDPTRVRIVALTSELRLIRNRKGPGWPERRAELKAELLALDAVDLADAQAGLAVEPERIVPPRKRRARAALRGANGKS